MRRVNKRVNAPIMKRPSLCRIKYTSERMFFPEDIGFTPLVKYLATIFYMMYCVPEQRVPFAWTAVQRAPL